MTGVPLETPARIVRALADRGYNAEREAVTLIAGATDPAATLDRAIEAAPDDTLVLTTEHVRLALADDPGRSPPPEDTETLPNTPSVSTGTRSSESRDSGGSVPVETEGSEPADAGSTASETATDPESPADSRETGRRSVTVSGDITGHSTGTGAYEEFVRTFRDRFERLSGIVGNRITRRPIETISEMAGGSEAGMVGLVNDVRSTASGHWLVELEDTTGTFPALVMKDESTAEAVETLLLDECLAIEGTLADDGGVLFADTIHFPDVPRTNRPSTADRHVQAALVSDIHVGSQEFAADAWERFADWLHTDAATAVEYLLIAGDMVEGVGVYPDQDEELDIVDIYEQYETFAERLKAVPGDLEIVMIPGNHDAVRLAEPQPGFDEELRSIMSAHDARIVGNPSTVTIEGVSVLMYHGVSLDEVIAELPKAKASYDEPQNAMTQLLRKRHVAPQYGGQNRLAPEDQDYLVIEEVPDVFHTGHVHKIGWGEYRGVRIINSGCWQEQTAFQRSVNIDPDVGYAPILDLDTLELTVRKFA